MTRSGRSRWQSILALAAIAFVCGAARSAEAQNYRSLKPMPVAEARALTGKVSTILRGAGNPSADDLKVLDDYFMKYFFPSMTVYQPPEALGQLSTSRDWLFTRYLNVAKSQAARDHLTNNTLKAMGAIAQGAYHPAVRYNAALIVGQLEQTPGTPLPASNDVLLALLEKDEINKVPVPTALKVAAIVGLQRRVNGMESALAERVRKAATAVALRKETPDDATPEVYGWVRRSAARLLAAQVAGGMTPDVHQTMVTLISDKSIGLDDRCNIAQLLKPAMYQKAEGLDVESMTIALGDLAKQVLAVETKDAKKYLDELFSGGAAFAPGPGGGFPMGRGGEMGGRGFGGGSVDYTMIEETGPTYERRRMIDRLLAVADGASAVAAGGTDESKAKLRELVAALRDVAVPAAEERALVEKIAPAVQTLSVDVNKLVATWVPAATTEDDAEADEFGAAAAPAPAEPAEEDSPPAADEDDATEEAPAEPAAGPAAEAPAAAAG